MTFCKVITVAFLIAVLTIESSKGDDDGLPCPYASGNCQTLMKKVSDEEADEELIVLEVSCQCKYSKDVSKNIRELTPIMCPYVPESAEESELDIAILRIDNCNVVDEEFPIEMIKVLRRAKEFHINITNVNSLRLESAKTYEFEMTPKIDATFKNSNISGIGVGWVSHSTQLNLIMENSNVSILENRFISNNGDDDSSVNIKIINCEITTINSFAFILPSKGSLQIHGSRIEQIESEAISGGHTVRLESSIIANMQTHSISTFGLSEFKLIGCIVARIEEGAIMEENARRTVPRINQRYSSENVSIIGNKFTDVNNGSFELLCREKNLKFMHNFFNNISSTIILKGRHCGTSRDWWTSVNNNGFNCSNYNKFLSGQIDEQVCAAYETGWCLCPLLKDLPDSYVTHDNKTDKGNRELCRKPLREFLEENFSTSSHFKNYNSHCEVHKANVPTEVKEAWSTYHSTSSVTVKGSSLVVGLAVVLLLFIFSHQLG